MTELIIATVVLLIVFLAYVLIPIYKYNIQTCITKEDRNSVYLATAVQATFLTTIFLAPIATLSYMMQ